MLAGFSLLLPACGINTIPTQEEKVNSAWAMVEVQYQRRADLIPNLVSTVKGAAAQELELFSRISELRTGGPQKLPQSFLGTLSSDPEKLRAVFATSGATWQRFGAPVSNCRGLSRAKIQSEFSYFAVPD